MLFNNTPLYAAGFASDLLRGIDEFRPWNLNNVVLSKTTATTTLLDIGSGDARKMIPLANKAYQITAMEPSPAMRSLANERIIASKIENIQVIDGRCESIPFLDNSFDLVTCSLAPWVGKEVQRILPPGGWFINETIGCEDKLNFKSAFGKNLAGNWRGQQMSLDNNACIRKLTAELEPFFDEINIINGFWTTTYTQQGLLDLCLYTSTIADFNLEKDRAAFESITNKLMAEDGTIELTQNRLLITARKLC